MCFLVPWQNFENLHIGNWPLPYLVCVGILWLYKQNNYHKWHTAPHMTKNMMTLLYYVIISCDTFVTQWPNTNSQGPSLTNRIVGKSRLTGTPFDFFPRQNWPMSVLSELRRSLKSGLSGFGVVYLITFRTVFSWMNAILCIVFVLWAYVNHAENVVNQQSKMY